MVEKNYRQRNFFTNSGKGKFLTQEQGDLCLHRHVRCELKPFAQGSTDGTLIISSTTPLGPNYCPGLAGKAAAAGQPFDIGLCEADAKILANASKGNQQSIYYVVRGGGVEIAGSKIGLSDFTQQVDQSAIQPAETTVNNPVLLPGLVLGGFAIGAYVVYRTMFGRREGKSGRAPHQRTNTQPSAPETGGVNSQARAARPALPDRLKSNLQILKLEGEAKVLEDILERQRSVGHYDVKVSYDHPNYGLYLNYLNSQEELEKKRQKISELMKKLSPNREE
ncbi:hypothetical protein A2954_01585 [Candidatus Roizmanbacteria bacterium RIFCSPLOWO2_01_FULL_37_12]|uniref:Uncharacterized protein n=1 Tax=Candidatus Roizmanbacteria bacterium RIFCSPLOWO2_01_FULL_37_12 TaxID=1802056 RepID=A0A1F7IA16_9BACT|nr:MAG: hypothetical protein A2954_01585 [Candidatus Roizmanbacteria bacterium RIFCSPLOWO2_01_FULL_37_12]